MTIIACICMQFMIRAGQLIVRAFLESPEVIPGPGPPKGIREWRGGGGGGGGGGKGEEESL